MEHIQEVLETLELPFLGGKVHCICAYKTGREGRGRGGICVSMVALPSAGTHTLLACVVACLHLVLAAFFYHQLYSTYIKLL